VVFAKERCSWMTLPTHEDEKGPLAGILTASWDKQDWMKV